MTIVRVQLKRRLAGGPTIGKWDTYSGAWFSTTNVVPSTAVQKALVDLFSGWRGDSAYPITHSDVFDQSSGASNLSVWAWDGTHQVHQGDYSPSIARSISPNYLVLPAQCALAVGYKATVTGPRQRGRSRFWLGPLKLTGGSYTATASGGVRLTAAAVDSLTQGVHDCLGLLAGSGWVLQVKSGSGSGVSFHPANEVYVDDVLDVMRSRRTWQQYQKRLTI